MIGTLSAKIHNLDKKEYDVAKWSELENGEYGAFDTMVAVCEMGALLDNVNREDYAEVYREYLREARYEKNDFRKFCKKLKHLFLE